MRGARGRVKVDRPALRARFEAGLDRKLTLVEAPLGYGKTTLMRSWRAALRGRGYATGYVALESDGAAAAALVGGALVDLASPQTRPDAAARPARLDLFTAAPSFKWVVDLVRAIDRPTCLFIDDFHEAAPNCGELIQTVLRTGPPALHLVIGTREAPLIPLAKLRLDDHVADFGIEDLKFDHDSALALFGGEQSAEYVKNCVDYCEGWVAALQLFRLSGAASPKEPAPAASLRHLNGLSTYLNEQYFTQLSADQRDFLIETSHLECVNGDLADHVRQSDQSWTMLQGLARAHALVFEDMSGDGLWFRYHRLLRDFLIAKQAQRGSETVARLRLRAADWLARAGRRREAMAQANGAGAPERAERLLLEAGGVQLGMLRGAADLASCLAQLPHHRINAHPRLAAAQAYLMLKAGRLREAALLLAELGAAAPADDLALGRDLALVNAHLTVYQDAPLQDADIQAFARTAAETPVTDPLMRGLLHNFLCMFLTRVGRLGEARLAAETAMALYTDLRAKHLQFFMHLHLSAIDLEIGEHETALRRREEARALCERYFGEDLSLRALADVYCAEALFELGRVDGVEDMAARAVETVDHGEGWGAVYLAGYETCLTLGFLERGYGAVVDYLERAESMIARRGLNGFADKLGALALDMAARAGRLREARRLAVVAERRLAQPAAGAGLRWRGRFLTEMALARFEAASDQAAEAIARLERVEATCRDQGFTRYAHRALVRKTVLATRCGRETLATSALKAALAAASRQGGRAAFLAEADAFPEAANWIVRHGGLAALSPDEVSCLADLLWRMSDNADHDAPNILSELLTEKEFEVMSELASGGANKVIARRLAVSETTVKFHLQNIYRKLGVNSRKLAKEIASRYGAPRPDGARQQPPPGAPIRM